MFANATQRNAYRRAVSQLDMKTKEFLEVINDPNHSHHDIAKAFEEMGNKLVDLGELNEIMGGVAKGSENIRPLITQGFKTRTYDIDAQIHLAKDVLKFTITVPPFYRN